MALKTVERNEDKRSKKIVFVSSCLLNTNNKVQGLARYGGMCKEVFDELEKYGLGINQMPCTETLYLGIQRWWATKNLYDNVGFRKHCRELAEGMADYMTCYETVAVLSCDGSPTCGVKITSFDEQWGGCPADLSYNDAIIEGSGVYIEELKAEIEERGLKMPPFYGLSLDDESADMESILSDYRAFIHSVCKL
jgi:predicted secreted protein